MERCDQYNTTYLLNINLSKPPRVKVHSVIYKYIWLQGHNHTVEEKHDIRKIYKSISLHPIKWF